MKNNIIRGAGFTLFLLTACGPNKKSGLINPGAAPATSTVVTPAPVSPAPAGPTATPITSAQPAVAAGTGALNPAHGQPNHRCDIPVGAPLNSPAQAAPAAPQIKAPVLPTSPVAGPVAPGMNPPHGQPGHDCGLPVGAPLAKK